MEHVDQTKGARQPILLPKGEWFTRLIVEKTHTDVLQSGVLQPLSNIRKSLWIPSGRATVRSVLRQCLTCRRHEDRAYKMPDMAPLPRTGVDYLGPLYVKGKDGVNKVWTYLFTCLVTPAVHLEMMNNMSSDEFSMGFRRFIATRGRYN